AAFVAADAAFGRVREGGSNVARNVMIFVRNVAHYAMLGIGHDKPLAFVLVQAPFRSRNLLAGPFSFRRTNIMSHDSVLSASKTYRKSGFQPVFLGNAEAFA